jgi:beta-glucosidase
MRRTRGAVLVAWLSAAALTIAPQALVADAAVAAHPPNVPRYPWLDPALSAEERAHAAAEAMTFDEKLSWLQGDTTLDANGTGINSCVGHLPSVERLGLPALCFGDGPAGVGNGMTHVTEFPAPIAGASTWDLALMRTYGMALGEEHAGKGRNVVLAPTLNILRTPRWGRAAESLGEDPYLTGRLGVALIEGIQSWHVIATPKHFVANNQETLRLGDAPAYSAIDVRVSERALREIYFPAFEAAVREAQAGSIMCSYNQVNGVYACQNPALDTVLRGEWKFDGFVVSDWYFAQRSTLAAARAGLDVSMPGGSGHFGFPAFYGEQLRDAFTSGALPPQRLNTMVENILRPMFRLGLVECVQGGGADTKRTADADVRTAAHRALALRIASQGVVLLKNQHGVLPLNANVRTIAVIGDDAGEHVQTTERYGGFVTDPAIQVRTPLAAITERAGASIKVSYARGTLGTGALPTVPAWALSPLSRSGSGLTAFWYGTADWSGPILKQTVEPTIGLHEPPSGLPPVWSVRWQGALNPPKTGRYRFSLSGGGDAVLYIDGREVVHTLNEQFSSITHGVTTLTGGRPVTIRLEYSRAATISKPTLEWGWQEPDDLLMRAVAAARQANVAIVFASDNVSEGGDRTSLNLPGDQNDLIAAVTAANPHTVVVLHTVGPVLMPWLTKAAVVLEAWYPGEEAGAAITGILFGDANPSGKLPMTFPRSEWQGPDTMPAHFPGVAGTVTYAEGLSVGYRYYDAEGQAPLFPFGFGLSYSRYRIGPLRVMHGGGSAWSIEGSVTNVGQHDGATVVELYVGFPSAAGEPPWQLKGFERIELAVGERREVRFDMDRRALSVWDDVRHRWQVIPGRYRIAVGSSSRDLEQYATLVE